MARDVLTKRSIDYVKIAVSYHEAGHAFIAAYNYLKVLDISITNINDSFVHYNPFEYDLDKLIVFELQMLYAGFIAEKIYYKDICGSNIFPANLYGAYDDTKSASKLIKKYKLLFPNKSISLLKKQCKKIVKTILQEHFTTLKLVAHAIYKNEKLSGEEFKNILIYKTNNKQFWREKYKSIERIHSDNKLSSNELEIIFNDIFASR